MNKPKPQKYGWHTCCECNMPTDLFTDKASIYSHKGNCFCSKLCFAGYAYRINNQFLITYVNL